MGSNGLPSKLGGKTCTLLSSINFPSKISESGMFETMANAGNGIVDGIQIGIESEEIGSMCTEVDEKRLSGSVPASKKAGVE